MGRWGLVALALCNAMAMQVRAETLPDWVKLDGFGTVGVYHADDPYATVRSDIRTSTGARNEIRFDADSLFAVQLKLRPAGPFNAGFQLISKKEVNSSHRPRVQWAYLGWEPSSEINIKLGRALAPVFLMSDYNDLYYAQISAQPPGQVYSNNSITFNDGVTGQWERHFGEGVLGIEGYYGKTRVDVSLGEIEVPKQAGLSAKWTSGPLLLRLGYSRPKGGLKPFAGNSVDQFLGLVRDAQQLGLCSNCNQVYRERFKLTDVVNKMVSVGFSWDDDTHVVQGEWVSRKSDSAILSGSGGWYLLGARRIGDFTPYLVLGSLKPIAEPVDLRLTPPPQATQGQMALLSALAAANATNVTGQYHRDQLALGLRWDFSSNMALKLQWDQYKIKNRFWGSSNKVEFRMGPQSQFDGKVNTYTANFDFIF